METHNGQTRSIATAGTVGVAQGQPRRAQALADPTAEGVTPTAVPVRAPKWLSIGARKAWKETAPRLQFRGLANADRHVLAAYCEAVGQYEQCIRILEREGLTYTTVSSYVAERPGRCASSPGRAARHSRNRSNNSHRPPLAQTSAGEVARSDLKADTLSNGARGAKCWRLSSNVA